MSRVLIIDDEESICWGLARLCEQMSLEHETASSAERGLELAEAASFDVIIMDVRLPGIDGLSAIEQFHKRFGKVPIIIITAFGDLDTAIGAIQKGAFEYIVKPFELEVVKSTIGQAIVANSLQDYSEPSQDLAEPSGEPEIGLVGSSAVMQEVFKQIALTTTSDAPVLITGESGTGKELTARSIHRFGSRSSGPFVAVNIAALSPSLVESELFGHVEGAFTGANSKRVGLVEQANGGSLFLDEIAEVSLDIQVKLLRVLDQGEVVPVGSNTAVKTDFRLISATHQDLLAQINHGEFRHDLLYRLRTFEVRLPPLRDRKDDIPELVEHFLRKSATADSVSPTPDFLDALKDRQWPGNVRELQSVVERAAAFSKSGFLSAEHLVSQDEKAFVAPENDSLETKIQTLVREWTRKNWNDSRIELLYEELISVIDPAILPTAFKLGDNQYSAASRRLGIHRTTLKKKLDEMQGDD
ncbi:sigma-54-dependent transcriptional regulator [Mariniblastus fucicola]|uniref:DNA-binding transcriptional regulator NtrC n=1 Tax=Mariniblastus fucicola TaxID=980251 RepID=A0A5B9P809_9BACT|nr:sigma-54 dependent transcriptional regulator [Mariniblastus fucicola]QEG22454.1 Nitrogen assimilation regulatory protein [Mariniblastus fucicola]